MREIVLDTETTGLNPLQGHRLVEIGCVELFNHVATGKVYHVYLNPQREVPEEASRVHGLTDEFLADKPLFTEIVGDFLDFIADTTLVIHNAAFDMGFINAELTRAGFSNLPMSRAIDTVAIARKKFFGAPASLDALCKRFNIDNSNRQFHGALLDAQLLAEVYLELCGGRQTALAMPEQNAEPEWQDDLTITDGVEIVGRRREFLSPRLHEASEEERAAHDKFLDQIKKPLWRA